MVIPRFPRHLCLAAIVALSRVAAEDLTPRLVIVNGSIVRSSDGTRVLPLGGNYVLKAQPYFPERSVVARNARSMAAGAAKMKYKPSDGRTVVPAVRLGVMLEGAMPEEAGVFDSDWQTKLEATVKAFADAGVYVFLDIHQDALASSCGGAGLPIWMTAKMQETAGEVPECPTCHERNAYITSAEHPLQCSVSELDGLLRRLGFEVPTPRTASKNDPWRAYSWNGGAGDPRRMNVGNPSMRINNDDASWSRGVLLLSQQVQNVAWRFYRSPRYPAEKAMFFDPYVAFVKYLCQVWVRHPNVIAVELLNEPPVGGLPDLNLARGIRRDLFDFYAAVARELDADKSVPRAPIAVQDITGNNGQVALLMALLDAIGLERGLRSESVETLQRWTIQGRLILSFHYYPPTSTETKLKEWISSASALSKVLGGAPVWLSEHFDKDRDEVAHIMALAAEMGCEAVTFWHFVDSGYTGNMGWYKGRSVINKYGWLDWEAWQEYEKTVANGTYWGAAICGSDGGKMDVLPHVPPVSAARVEPAETELLWIRRPPSIVFA